eukprot:365872-Chlamydomonas_euryale.AAC.8
MDGWVCGCVGGWVDGRCGWCGWCERMGGVRGWMDGWCERMDGWTDGWMDGWTDGFTHEQMDGCTIWAQSQSQHQSLRGDAQQTDAQTQL